MGVKREREEGEKEKKKTKKGRSPCCDSEGVTRGAWTPEEDKILVDFITENGHGTWRNLPHLAGLLRCGKSCRLRWANYLRPDIKRGPFTPEEEATIVQLHGVLGNKWAAIASHLQGRTDNDVKNFWNSHLRKRFDAKARNQPSPTPSTSKPVGIKPGSSTFHTAQWESVRIEAESRFSTAPPPLANKGDYFLKLWNSEVGESFRSMNESANESTSQSSSLTKVESTYLPEPSKTSSSVEMKLEARNCKLESEDIAAFSDTSKSYEVDDSSDAMLKMLLDFPIGGNDMAFLEPPSFDVSTYDQD